MVNKIGLSNFFKLYEYFGKTEMYHLYRLYNTFAQLALSLNKML